MRTKQISNEDHAMIHDDIITYRVGEARDCKKRVSGPHWLGRWVRRFRLWIRKREIARNCGCVTYCPKCRDPLNDQAYWLASNGEGLGTYKCRVCGNVSEWHFGIAPVAVLLSSSHTKSSPNVPDQQRAP